FVRDYLTEAIATKVADAAKAPEVEMPNRQIDAARATVGPSKRANKMAGIHVVKPDQCGYSHRLDIRWFEKGEATDAEGWHFADLDSADASFYHNGPESLLTSQNCLAMAETNLTDD